MILWHTADAWTAASARQSAGFQWIVLIGGWAAPLFLFLAGVSVALAGRRSSLLNASGAPPPLARAPAFEDSLSSRGPRAQRGWQIFLIAHLFRLQSFLLNPGASWSSLLKPDILNILGLGMVVAAVCWKHATAASSSNPARRIAWLAGPAAAIILLTPWSREWQWPVLMRPYAPFLESYVRPVGGLGGFSIFPWMGFVFAGALVGLFVAESRPADAHARFYFRLGLAGAGIGLAGFIGIHLPPPFAPSSFWTTSLSFFLIRIGVMTAAIPSSWLWMRRPGAAHWSPLVLFGRTSLFVYWVHVELAYGFATFPIHARLPLAWALAGFVTLTLLMLGLAALWVRRRQPLIPGYLTVAPIGPDVRAG